MRILITGTPGTGKTEVAKELGALTGWEVIHISEVVLGSDAASRGKDGPELEVDVSKLTRVLTPLLAKREDAIFEGHLGCELPCPAELVIVLRANPDELEKRMEKRGYHKTKVEGNIMAELLDYCYTVAKKNYSCEVLELDTSGKTARENARRIYAYLNGKKDLLDKVNWIEHLKRKTRNPA
ncbi:AAA family ATPase [Candidatus Micrarchaeota archaeon]|nr:AAA family ATPase [Candidatus Micrarchaeota archaeon]